MKKGKKGQIYFLNPSAEYPASSDSMKLMNHWQPVHTGSGEKNSRSRGTPRTRPPVQKINLSSLFLWLRSDLK